ncbi:MAG: electron transport complex subunit RsxC [Planctomycetes bacterium]|nr:electron transport complex subunit RsxC [Planctomycetota bacterium]
MIATRRRFDGGVHPPERKSTTSGLAIEPFPAPPLLAVPLVQHIGAPARPAVEKGARILKGQVIGEAGGFVSSPVHAPVSGSVKAIEDRPSFAGRPVPHVVIENDGREAWAEGCDAARDTESMPCEALLDAIREAGIVGMGGAAFPTHVKLAPPPGKTIDAAILNGVECEPYLTCDDRLMRERPDAIVAGFRIILRVLGVERGFVGIEENKPDAIRAMRDAFAAVAGVEVVALPVRYPQGAEKQLIRAILGREVPSGGLPMDVGVVVQNVGTAAAIADACGRGIPLIERAVTVTGGGVDRPANLRVRIGTPIRALIERCGLRPTAERVILGGPMMGIAQQDLEIAATKGTSGVLVLAGGRTFPIGPCIRCGACVRGCPARLVPSELSVAVERDAKDLYEGLDAMDCIECGVCTYVCPARRPIVHWIRIAKAHVAARRAKKG